MQISKRIIVAGAGFVVPVAGGGVAYAAAAPSPSPSAPAATSPTAVAPKVTAEQAVQVALKEVPGSWVSELDYDRRGTQPDVWEVELTNGTQQHELNVDAATSAVTDRETKQAGTDDDSGDDD
ncbi:PepSY domain-containing protein [Nonomuraea sp. NPDC002799]